MTTQLKQLIAQRVHEYYHHYDYNCAKTTLLTLGEVFNIPVPDPLLAAAVGMHGAGGTRAQCGLVEGTLLFIGYAGSRMGVAEPEIVAACGEFAKAFVDRFGSLQCRELRRGGFQKTDPPHLCETLSVNSVLFSAEFLEIRWNFT